MMNIEKSYSEGKLVSVTAELPENVYLELYNVYKKAYLNPDDPVYNRNTPTLEYYMGFLIAFGLKHFIDTRDDE